MAGRNVPETGDRPAGSSRRGLVALQIVFALAAAALGGCASGDDNEAVESDSLGFTSSIHYRYDAVGRLIQASASNGTGVQYSYDAVGNIAAVRRLVANSLRVVDAAPASAAVGSSVVVFGSGFNPTAAQNTVKFNGTTAPVVSANETALTVTVPGAAVTGKITVSNALGTATSPSDFVVLGSSPAPTIISFTPAIGTLDTVVSVTGSNFQLSPADDKISVGGHLAELVQDAASPTASMVKFRVPSTTASGKIAVTTPFGTALSASEFFAVPSLVDPATVQFTGRVAVAGGAIAATTTVAGKKLVIVFAGQAGQRLHVLTSGGTFASSFSSDLYAPTGTLLQRLTLTNNGVADLAAALASTGTYTLVINPLATDKGTVQLSVVGDVVGTLAIDSSTPVTIAAGQNARMSFSAQANTGYGLALTALGFTPTTGVPVPSIGVTLRKSDGTSITTCSFSASGSCDLNPNAFPAAGTYLLDFDTNSTYAASFAAVLSADATGATTVDAASPTAVTIARAGQNARYTFSGTAGSLLNVVVSGSTLDDGNSSTPTAAVVQVFKPNDAVAPIGSTSFNIFATGAALDVTLPVTGTYTVLISPGGLDLGTVNLSVKSTATGALAVDGTTSVNLSSGRNGRFTFTAQAGKGYGLAVTGLSLTQVGASPPSLTVTLRKADGTVPATPGTCSFTSSGSCDLDPASFATAGTYILEFDPSGLTVASFTAVLSTDVGGAVIVDAAAPTPMTIARAGQNARYTFSGTAGGMATVVVSGSTLDDGSTTTFSATQVLVFKPSDSVSSIASQSFTPVAGGATVDLTFPVTGTYTVWINPTGLDFGTANVAVKSVATGTLTVDGSTAVNLSAGRNGRYSFTAQAGKGYGLAVTGLAFTPSTGSPPPSLLATLRKADGTSLTTCTFTASGSCDLSPASFATAGTYLLDFDPAALFATSFSAVLSTDASGSVTIDAPSPTLVTFARPGQNARYSVAGTAGQLVKVLITANALDDGNTTTTTITQLTVFKPSSPNASPIGSTSFATTITGTTLNLTLPETGTYIIAINPSELDSGTLNLGLAHQ